MGTCSCPLPSIYTSKTEALLSGTGHIRFFIRDDDPTHLSVIQKATDPNWHCACTECPYWPVYEDLLSRSHLNKNGKRIAEATELELVSQSGINPKSVKRVLPAAVDVDVSSLLL